MIVRGESFSLAARGAFSGHLVFDDGFGDGEGEAVLVVGALDVSSLSAIGEEAAFEENGGMLDASDDGVAGAAHAAVAATGISDDGGVNSGGEGDVGGVVIVAGLFTEVGGFESASVVGYAFGGEGECFDALGVTAAAGVEVEGDEDGVGVLVGEVYALLEGEILVGAAGEADLEAAFAELGGELLSEGEGMVLFAAVAVGAGGAGVVSAVAGVDDDGVDTGWGATDVVRTHDGVEELDEVDAVDEVAVT